MPMLSSYHTTRPPAAARRQRPGKPPSLAALALLGVALFAMALPIVGPLDDHHFAERTHTHQHIYLDGRPAAHRHIYERRGHHLHRHLTPGALAGNAGAPASAGVGDGAVHTVFLTSGTAGLLLSALSAPCHTAPEALRPPAPRAGNASLLGRFASPFRCPEGVCVTPPHRPPVV